MQSTVFAACPLMECEDFRSNIVDSVPSPIAMAVNTDVPDAPMPLPAMPREPGQGDSAASINANALVANRFCWEVTEHVLSSCTAFVCTITKQTSTIHGRGRRQDWVSDESKHKSWLAQLIANEEHSIQRRIA